MNPHITPEDIATAHDHARLARDLVHALGAGDEIGAAHLLGNLTHRDALGVAVQTAQIVLAVQRDLLPGTSVDELCDRLGQGARR